MLTTGHDGRARPTIIAVLSALLLLSGLAFAASTLLREPGSRAPWADDGLYNLCFLLAAAIAALRGWNHRDQRGWLVMSVGLLMYAAGGLTYALAATLGLDPDTPSLADAFWLTFLPLAFVGLLMLTRERLRIAYAHAWLEALTVGFGAFAVAIAIVEAQLPADITGSATSIAVNSLYVLGDLVLLTVMLATAQAFNWRPPASWWLLFAGFALFALTDATYIVETANQTYVEGGALDIGWPASAVLIGLAAGFDQPRRTFDRREARVTLLAPSIALIAAGLVLLASPPASRHWVSTVAALVTLLLGVIRMNLAVRDTEAFAARIRAAEADPLTGLLNRRGLQALGPRSIHHHALVVLDLDGFTDVNESLGHAAGDLVLLEVAGRLSASVRTSDTVARLGSDDFAVLLERVDVAEAIPIAESLIRRIEQPITVHGIEIPISACAGIALVSTAADNLDDATREAAAALTRAKESGVGIVHAFDGAPGGRSVERLQLRGRIRDALTSAPEEFVPYYQPIVRLLTGEIYAVEALVRWHRGGQVLTPGMFLREVQHAGAMGQLTRLMLHRTLGELRNHGLPYAVTVNLTPELIDDALPAMLESALHDTESTADQLILEITEDALVRDPVRARRILEEVRGRGIRVLLDDFGTGWSGFSTLRDLTADGLKIDSSFVERMNDDSTAMSIIRSIEMVADDLGAVVIYEGAEGDATIQTLRQFESGYSQGFGIARPMPVQDLVRWSYLRSFAPTTHQD